MTDEDVIREHKRQVHRKRYVIVADKITKFADEVRDKGSLEVSDHIKYGLLMEQAHEALLSVYEDLLEDLRMFEEKIK